MPRKDNWGNCLESLNQHPTTTMLITQADGLQEKNISARGIDVKLTFPHAWYRCLSMSDCLSDSWICIKAAWALIIIMRPQMRWHLFLNTRGRCFLLQSHLVRHCQPDFALLGLFPHLLHERSGQAALGSFLAHNADCKILCTTEYILKSFFQKKDKEKSCGVLCGFTHS